MVYEPKRILKNDYDGLSVQFDNDFNKIFVATNKLLLDEVETDIIATMARSMFPLQYDIVKSICKTKNYILLVAARPEERTMPLSAWICVKYNWLFELIYNNRSLTGEQILQEFERKVKTEKMQASDRLMQASERLIYKKKRKAEKKL